jgi:hypothetical protein
MCTKLYHQNNASLLFYQRVDPASKIWIKAQHLAIVCSLRMLTHKQQYHTSNFLSISSNSYDQVNCDIL